jgi:hypothetical protein
MIGAEIHAVSVPLVAIASLAAVAATSRALRMAQFGNKKVQVGAGRPNVAKSPPSVPCLKCDGAGKAVCDRCSGVGVLTQTTCPPEQQQQHDR